MEENNNVVRVNTRVSKDMMKWLDERSAATAIPKSTIITMALEEYRQKFEVLDMAGVMNDLVNELKRLDKVK